MKIFQVKYNQGNYCYFKADAKELFKEDTNLYKTYTDCQQDKDKLDGFEMHQLRKSLINYFKKIKQ